MNNVDPIKPAQGIVFDAWEVAAIAKLYGDGMQIKLSDLSAAFSSHIVPLKDAPVAALFVDGIRTAAQGNQPAKRCWARFIAELGRRSVQPYDLLSQNLHRRRTTFRVGCFANSAGHPRNFSGWPHQME